MTRKETTNNDLGVAVGVLVSKVDEIYKKIERIEGKLDRDVATKEWVNSEYGEQKKKVEGIFWTIVVTVVLAGLSLLLKK